MSPFYANYGYHPHASLKIRTEPSAYENPATKSLVERLETYKRKFDRKANPAPSFKVGNLVWLNRRNIATTRPSRKLDFKQFGPFKILKIIGEGKAMFQLELPPQWQIHDVFHSSLLDPHRPNDIEGRKQPILQPPEIVQGELEYVVEGILDSKR